MSKLEQAARQIIVDWDSGIHLYEAITALREALTEQAECPHGVDDGACKECYMEQAEQEPVAYAGMIDGSVCAVYTQWPVSSYHKIKPLYAAPVHTVDLSDYEIRDIWHSADTYDVFCVEFARAVIAAYKEKNQWNS